MPEWDQTRRSSQLTNISNAGSSTLRKNDFFYIYFSIRPSNSMVGGVVCAFIMDFNV